jgi:hypothetical protein
VDDIDFMADLQRVEEDRLALIRENELLQRQQVRHMRMDLFCKT